MTGSALLGHPPNTQEDVYIIRGFYMVTMGASIIRPLPPSAVIPVKAPPGAQQSVSTELLMPMLYLATCTTACLEEHVLIEHGLPALASSENSNTDPDALNSDNDQGRIIATMTVLMTLITLITGARLSLRLFRKDLKFGFDDWAIIVALIGVLSWCSIVLAITVLGGGGKHMYDITYADFDTYLSLSGVGQILFYPVVGVIKISISLFNRRLTGLTSRAWMMVHNIFLVLIVSYVITSIFLDIFSCNPPILDMRLSRLGESQKPRHCLSTNAVVIPLSVIHVVFDFALLSIPIIILCKMQMSLSKKIRISFLFAVGAISCLGAVMRLVYFNRKHIDLTYDLINFLKWTLIDIFFSITAASLPVLNALVPKSWLRTSSEKSTPGPTQGWSKGKSISSSSRIQEPESRGSVQYERDAEKGGSNISTDSPVRSVGKRPNWDEYYVGMEVPGTAR